MSISTSLYGSPPLLARFSIKKALAICEKSEPPWVGAGLRQLEASMLNCTGTYNNDDADIAAALASCSPSLVSVAGLHSMAHIAQLYCNSRVTRNFDTLKKFLQTAQGQLANGDSSVRAAAVTALRNVVVAASPDDVKELVSWCADSGAGASFDDAATQLQWCSHEARVMALNAIVQVRGTDPLCRDVVMRCVFAVALPQLTATASHKYVRVASMHLFASAVEAWSAAELSSMELPLLALAHGTDFVVSETGARRNCLDLLTLAVAAGATGGGPEVRFAASVALRSIVRFVAPTLLLAEPLCSRWLPPLVLARYYGPERQRRYNQQTWQLIIKSLQPHVSSAIEPSATAADALPLAAPGVPLATSMRSLGHTGSSRDDMQEGASLSRGFPSPPISTERGSERAASPSRSRSLACALLDSCLLNSSGVSFVGPAVSTGLETSGSAASSVGSPTLIRAGDGSHGDSAASKDTSGVAASAGSIGPELVARHISDIVRLYCAQLADSTDADAREAAACCVAELAGKVDRNAVRPHITVLLTSLWAVARDDDSWACRDAAIVASAKLLLAFVADVSAASVTTTVELCIGLLADSHRVVRDHAAISLVELARSLPHIRAAAVAAAEEGIGMLPSCQLKSETAASTGPVGSSALVAVSGDGSPAPQAHSGMPIVHWDRLAGIVCLIRELAPLDPVAAAKLLENLLDKQLSAPSCPMLPREVLCRSLPALCTGIGKSATKRLLDALIVVICGVIFDSAGRLVPGSDRGAAHASSDATVFLRGFVGQGVFRGHLSPTQADLLAHAADVPLDLMRRW